MTGTKRLTLTAVLFVAALVLLAVAIFTHTAVPLFVMWLPLLAVPLVLGRAEPRMRQAQTSEPQGPGPRTDTTDPSGSIPG